MITTLLIASLVSQVPAEVKELGTSVCYVRASDGGLGSGALMTSTDGIGWVSSCYHVTGPTGSVVHCTFKGLSEPLRGRVAASDRSSDASIIRLESRPPGIPGIPIARYPVKVGERSYALGNGSPAQPLSAHIGRVVPNRLVNQSTFEVSGTARQGDSGGPILVIRGKQPCLVGAITGHDGRRILGPRLRVFRRLFGMRIYRDEKKSSSAVRPKLVPASGNRGSSVRQVQSFCPSGSSGST